MHIQNLINNQNIKEESEKEETPVEKVDKNVELENMDHIVQSMIDAVKSGRTKKRIRSEDNSEIKVFDNIDSLSSFLSTL